MGASIEPRRSLLTLQPQSQILLRLRRLEATTDMAASGISGPVMVQEAAIIDLTSSDPANERSYEPAGVNAPTATTKDDSSDDGWEDASMYEEILDEAPSFDYSTDGECNPLGLRIVRY